MPVYKVTFTEKKSILVDSDDSLNAIDLAMNRFSENALVENKKFKLISVFPEKDIDFEDGRPVASVFTGQPIHSD